VRFARGDKINYAPMSPSLLLFTLSDRSYKPERLAKGDKRD